jgi:hypothetical protein
MTIFKINGEFSPRTWDNLNEVPWPHEAKRRYQVFAAELEKQEGKPVTDANYAEPRPWKNEYDRGSNYHSLLLTVGHRHVFMPQQWTDDGSACRTEGVRE